MIEAIEVCAILKEYTDFEDMGATDLLLPCQQGLDWVRRHLRDDVNENDPLIIKTAAALARFNIFVKRIGETERYKSYKVGDMTIQRNLEEEYNIEKEMRQQALIEAAEILKDGGFYFEQC
ncbi:MAG: hypothetical protein NC122_09045 [Faecalibacterium sp.]|nr:hypothetical protein [Ruminococcus sp.]MCM1392673.1 hypothetical protein [Ruminococcus sp.]MCM1486341.1 hypothetical protein [Faecalibacterium sp.]